MNIRELLRRKQAQQHHVNTASAMGTVVGQSSGIVGGHGLPFPTRAWTVPGPQYVEPSSSFTLLKLENGWMLTCLPAIPESNMTLGASLPQPKRYYCVDLEDVGRQLAAHMVAEKLA